MKPPMAGRPLRSVRRGAALLLCAAILGACEPGAPPPPPVVTITVGDAPHQVPSGTTLGDVVARYGLEPRPGQLLSVSGSVIDPAIAPGRIELNGEPAPDETLLVSGDSILVKEGADRVEETRRIVERLAGRHPGTRNEPFGASASGDHASRAPSPATRSPRARSRSVAASRTGTSR